MRHCLLLLALAVCACAASVPTDTTVRGKLAIHAGGPATVETADHQVVSLAGDETLKEVLTDSRLDGFEVQARGHYTAPGRFQIDPFHTVPLLVRKDGHLKMITYWCDVCSIRAYTPGPCRCCQRETVLDLRDHDDK